MLLAEDNFVRQEMLHELIVAEEAKLIAMEKRRTAESGRRRWPAGYLPFLRGPRGYDPFADRGLDKLNASNDE
jgi:hypothetical protein